MPSKKLSENKFFSCAQKFQSVPKMSQLKQPKIWSNVPKGQKVATLNLEISPSSVLLYKKAKNCAKKKEEKAPNSAPSAPKQGQKRKP